MPDAIELLRSIKKASLDAVEAAKPVNICFGTVKSVRPLRIAVDQKLVLGEAQLILARHVTDYDTEVTVEWESGEALGGHAHPLEGSTQEGGEPGHAHVLKGEAQAVRLTHSHPVAGRKRLRVHNGLAAGEKVLLARQQEGQKYVVWDRVGI